MDSWNSWSNCLSSCSKPLQVFSSGYQWEDYISVPSCPTGLRSYLNLENCRVLTNTKGFLSCHQSLTNHQCSRPFAFALQELHLSLLAFTISLGFLTGLRFKKASKPGLQDHQASRGGAPSAGTARMDRAATAAPPAARVVGGRTRRSGRGGG